jgi:SAM-dependent methyltransferase
MGTASEQLVERLFDACIGALDLLHVYVGDTLGLYRALNELGLVTTADLAAKTGLAERYVREWCEHQAVAGIVAVDETGERFSLPEGHADVLVDDRSLSFFAPVGAGIVSLGATMPKVLDAFRTGGGVPYEAYGDDVRTFIERINRPMYLNLLAATWFPQVPGLVERLNTDPPARVADVGCGRGWSAISIGVGFPKAVVTGLDLDADSVETARRNAAAEGVADRVSFECRNAADPGLAGSFDLVCAFETIHDMCDPVGALRAMRSLRAEGGTVLVADEKVADEFTTDAEPAERFQWGWSALHCLPTAMVEAPAAGTGTIMRAPTLRRYAQQAGFADVEVLSIENDFWRFYRLVG